MSGEPARSAGTVERGAEEIAPRVATAITAWVFGMHAVNLLTSMFLEPDYPTPSPWAATVAVVLVAALFALQMLQTGWVGRSERRRYARIVLAVQVCLVHVPSLYYGSLLWLSLGGFDLGTALLVLRGRTRVLVVAGLMTLLAVQSYGGAPSASLLAYDLTAFAITGLVVFGVSQLRVQVHRLHAARDELAWATLTHQRLSHQKQLHAVVGRRLSEVGLRVALGRRLLATRPELARRELDVARGTARAALADARATAHEYRTSAGSPDAPAPPSDTALRRAWILLVAAVSGYAAVRAAQFLHFDVFFAAQRPAVEIVVSLACVGAVSGLVLVQVAWAGRPSHRRGAWLVLAAQAVLAFLPLAAFELVVAVMANLLAASVLLVLAPWVRWAAFATVGLVVAVAAQVVAPDFTAYFVIVTLNGGLAVYGLARLLLMVREHQEVRRQLAETVQASERTRFARDVHDLLGYSLSALTLKLDLAHRLADVDGDRARQELDHALDAARSVRSETLAVTQGDVELSLDEESTAVRQVLESAGIRVTLRSAPGPLTPLVEGTLALVLREATTNLLRHSDATRARIDVRVREDHIALDVTNDGVSTVPGPPSGGLANLAHRVAKLGGTLDSRQAGDSFHLTGRLPRAASVDVTDSHPGP